MASQNELDVVVIGGGIGGLACALASARRGQSVAVLEAGARLGGRGASEQEAGFTLNQGPHAIFEPSRAMLASLGVMPRAPLVSPTNTFIDDGARLHVLPGGVGSFFRTSYLDVQDRLSLGGLLPAVLAARADVTTTFGEWLRARALTPRVHALVEMLARVATYGADPAHACAPVVIAQIRAATIGGVRYVDGGWSAIVDGLSRALDEAGVEVALRTRASVIEPESNGFLVRTEGRVLHTRDVVIAGPRTVATSLLTPLGVTLAPSGPALRMACLDLGLDRLPDGAAYGAFGTTEPTYVSVHSATAALAPPGGAVVHAALYLGHRAPEPRSDRAKIETALDRAIPGWRSHVVLERSAPAALATSARVDAPLGLAGRQAGIVEVLSNEHRALALVGDWVGPRGLLLDAVLSSALEAAKAMGRARPSIVASSPSRSAPLADAPLS